MNVIELTASTAELRHEVRGDIGGNSQETVIEVVSDGGQFPLTEVRKTDTGFKIVIIGTWEAAEFMQAIALLSQKHKLY